MFASSKGKPEDLLYITPEFRLDTPERLAAQRERFAKYPVETLRSVLHSERFATKISTVKPLSSAAGRLAQEAADYLLKHGGQSTTHVAEELGWHPAGASGALNLAFQHGLVCRLEDGTWWHRDHLAKATWELLERRKS